MTLVSERPGRVALPPSLRFEVFKRDKFTCQYCGRKAPDVVLECDHMHPVAAGGTNDILNLVTGCWDCNRGKGAKQLHDTTVIAQQVDQLAQLEDRRQQLEMLLRWRDGLQQLQADTIAAVATRFEALTSHEVYPETRTKIAAWLRRFSVSDLLDGMERSVRVNLVHAQGEEFPDTESVRKAFNKIPAHASLAVIERERPYFGRLLYMQGIVRNRTRSRHLSVVDYLEHVHTAGMPLAAMETHLKTTSDQDLFDHFDRWLQTIGKPFT